MRSPRGRGWRRRTLPQGLPCSTIRAARLNGRVRDGNGCGPRAVTTSQFVVDVPGGMRGRCLADPLPGRGAAVAEPGRGDQDLNRILPLRFGVRAHSARPASPGAPAGGRTAVKPHGGLVRLSCTCHHASTCRLSTYSSRTTLQSAYALGMLILEGASHLDAFSGYPCPTSLPGHATGVTTGTQVVGPSRSSRTRDGSPQHSDAHDGYRPNCLTTF